MKFSYCTVLVRVTSLGGGTSSIGIIFKQCQKKWPTPDQRTIHQNINTRTVINKGQITGKNSFWNELTHFNWAIRRRILYPTPRSRASVTRGIWWMASAAVKEWWVSWPRPSPFWCKGREKPAWLGSQEHRFYIICKMEIRIIESDIRAIYV